MDFRGVGATFGGASAGISIAVGLGANLGLGGKGAGSGGDALTGVSFCFQSGNLVGHFF